MPTQTNTLNRKVTFQLPNQYSSKASYQLISRETRHLLRKARLIEMSHFPQCMVPGTMRAGGGGGKGVQSTILKENSETKLEFPFGGGFGGYTKKRSHGMGG